MSTIFETLRTDHDRQRDVMARLDTTEGDSDQRRELFDQLKRELATHAAAEEKYFYAALMKHDKSLEHARHSVAEHKELDDRVEELESIDASSPNWLRTFRELKHRVEHHLEEEEREVFPLAGKVLSDDDKETLGSRYRREMQDRLHSAARD